MTTLGEQYTTLQTTMDTNAANPKYTARMRKAFGKSSKQFAEASAAIQ